VNIQEPTFGDWVLYYAHIVLQWYWPVLHVVGFGLCVYAFKCCRKWGYLIFLLYYLLALFETFLSPAIDRAIDARTQLSPESIAAYHEELESVHQKYFPKMYATFLNVEFPLGPTLIVIGLWLFARRDVKGTPNKSMDRTETANGLTKSTP